jgi:hypothetical protein
MFSSSLGKGLTGLLHFVAKCTMPFILRLLNATLKNTAQISPWPLVLHLQCLPAIDLKLPKMKTNQHLLGARDNVAFSRPVALKDARIRRTHGTLDPQGQLSRSSYASRPLTCRGLLRAHIAGGIRAPRTDHSSPGCPLTPLRPRSIVQQSPSPTLSFREPSP